MQERDRINKGSSRKITRHEEILAKMLRKGNIQQRKWAKQSLERRNKELVGAVLVF